MVAGPAISDRDTKALAAIASGEPDFGISPAELADWLERPEINRLVETARWLAERRRRMHVHRAIERAMDHLSAALDAKADLSDNAQRAEVRRAATALGRLALTLLEGSIGTRSRSRASDFDPPVPRPSPAADSNSDTGCHTGACTNGHASAPRSRATSNGDAPHHSGTTSDPPLRLGACPPGRVSSPLSPPTPSAVLGPLSSPLSALSASSAVRSPRSATSLLTRAGTTDTS